MSNWIPNDPTLVAQILTISSSFRQYYGPTMNAFEAEENNGCAAALQKELDDLFDRQNQSPSQAGLPV